MLKERKIVHGIVLTILLTCTVYLIYSIVTEPLGTHNVMLACAVTAGFIALRNDKSKK